MDRNQIQGRQTLTVFAEIDRPAAWIPGAEFRLTRSLAVNLRPRKVPGGWQVPVITQWSVHQSWDRSTNVAELDIALPGTYTRWVYLGIYQVPFIYKDYGDPLLSWNQQVSWGLDTGESSVAVPVLLDDNEQSDLEVPILWPVWIVIDISNEHEVPLPDQYVGFNYPSGGVYVKFTYHWRHYTNIEFESVRKQ